MNSVINSRNVAFKEDIQHQDGGQPPENDIFVNLQPILLEKDHKSRL